MRSLRIFAATILLLPTLVQAQTYYFPASAIFGVTRASFVQMVINRAGGLQDGTDCFIDVKKQAYAPMVCAAKQRGIVTGDPSSRFRPDDAITFVEAVAVTVRATGGITVPYDILWYRPYLDLLIDWDAFPASVSNILNPITSSQAQELINNVFSADRSGISDGDDDGGSTTDNNDDDDLHLTVTASDSSADVGDTVTYTVKIRNDDNRDLHNLEVTAYLDRDFDYVSSTDDGVYRSDRIEWDDIDVDEDETETVTFKVKISGSADDGDKLSLRVRVEESEVRRTFTVDEDSDDDDDDDNDGDLRITISDSPSTAEPGETVTYSIRLRNEDNEDMRVDVRAALDNDMTFVSASDDGKKDDDQVEWDNILVEEDEEEIITLRVRIDSSADDGDTVRLDVRAEGEEDTETTEIEEDDDSDDDNEDDVTISISDTPDPAEVDDIVTYTIRLRSNVNNDIDVDVVAELDEGMTFYSATHGAERHGDEVRWEELQVLDDSDRTITLKVRINDDADDGDTLRLKVRVLDTDAEETTRIED